MDVRGRVKNGVVVLEGGTVLPEGAEVRVSAPVPLTAPEAGTRQRVKLPLVKSETPGQLQLTNDVIAEILTAEDTAALKGQWDVSS